MRRLVSASLVLVGILHVLPLVGVLGAAHLTRLYGLPFDEPNLEILMRHRAVLFGILGVFCFLAALRPTLQSLALAAGFVSVVSFLALATSVGGANAQVDRVFTVDLVALAALVVGSVAVWVERRRGAPDPG